MKKLLLLPLFCFILQISFAQKVEVEKNTGLVTVDGQNSFYLIKKNKKFLNYDFSLQNLNNEELAYLSCKDVTELPWDERGNNVGTFLRMVFSETGNTANVFPDGFAVMKSVAKAIVNGHLIKDNKIDPKSEKMFVVSRNGRINKDPESKPINITVTTTTATDKTKPATNISIKGNNIYNNEELIGTFKKITDSTKTTTLSIYNKEESKIAIATHNDGDENADWQITIVADNKKNQLLYNTSTPLEKLFKYLVDKGNF